MKILDDFYDDVYNSSALPAHTERDMITSGEEGFMIGYLNA